MTDRITFITRDGREITRSVMSKRLPEVRCGRLIDHGAHSWRGRRHPYVTSPLVTFWCKGRGEQR